LPCDGGDSGASALPPLLFGGFVAGSEVTGRFSCGR